MKTMLKLIALFACLVFASGAFAAEGDPVLLPGSTSITTLGPIVSGTWEATDIAVLHGGTGASDAAGAKTNLGFITDVVDDTTPQLGGDLDLNTHAIDFPTTANISDVLDEDNMASDSATSLATQQSIKAYVDAQVTSPGWGSIGAVTVSGGEIGTAGDIFFAVTGEGDAADAVTQLDGAAVGDLVVLKGKASLGYTITFTDGANLDLQANFLMNNQNDTLTLMCTATGTPDTFIEIARANNG